MLWYYSVILVGMVIAIGFQINLAFKWYRHGIEVRRHREAVERRLLVATTARPIRIAGKNSEAWGDGQWSMPLRCGDCISADQEGFELLASDPKFRESGATLINDGNPQIIKVIGIEKN